MDKKLVSICSAAAGGAFLAVICLGTLGGCGKKGDILAYVNGQPITLKEFYSYLQFKPQVSVETENGKFRLPVDGSLGYQALKDEINQMVELELAKEKNLIPTDAQIQKEIEFRLKSDPSYLLTLEAKGLTTDIIKKDLQAEMATERLLTEGVHVSTQDAKNYVNSHPKQFLEPVKVRLAYVLIKDKADTAKVDQELANGQSFTQVALEYSQATNAREYRGQFSDPAKPPIALNSLPAFLASAISSLHENESTGWLKFSEGYAKFSLTKLIPSVADHLDAQELEQLRRNLARAEGEKKNNVEALIQDKLKHSKIEIVQEAYKDDWANDKN